MKKHYILILIIVFICYYAYTSYVPKFNGIDISHHNRVNWEQIKENKDIEFCYIKATEGKSFRDPMCKKHSEKAKKTGLYVGLYHYFRTDISAEEQFANFQKATKEIKFDLIPVIDVENQGNDFSNISLITKRLRSLTLLFEKQYKTKPIIYIGNLNCIAFFPSSI